MVKLLPALVALTASLSLLVGCSDDPQDASGLSIKYNESGQKEWEGKYNKDRKPEGRWAYWNEDGSVNTERSGIYKDGKRIAPLPDK